VGHFYKVIYLSICQTANAGKFLVVCVQFLISALIFAPLWSQISHLFNFWGRIDLKRDWNLESQATQGKTIWLTKKI